MLLGMKDVTNLTVVLFKQLEKLEKKKKEKNLDEPKLLEIIFTDYSSV